MPRWSVRAWSRDKIVYSHTRAERPCISSSVSSPGLFCDIRAQSENNAAGQLLRDPSEVKSQPSGCYAHKPRCGFAPGCIFRKTHTDPAPHNSQTEVHSCTPCDTARRAYK